MASSHFHTSNKTSCKRKVYGKVSVVEDKAKNLVQTYNKENKIITQTIGSKVITYKYDFQFKRVSKNRLNHDSNDFPNCHDFW